MVSELVSVRGLTMRFGGVTALSNVDFRLGQNELCCIIGPNGAGKSTFFKCLTGQVVPTTGEILFEDHKLSTLSSHEIARLGIGIKTQVPSVFNGLSVAENVLMSLRRVYPRPIQEERLWEVAEQTGIADILGEQVETLAHGQRQLVELAMVMAPKPKLILLDEPAAGLTQHEVGRLADLVRLVSSQCALIVVEHDMSFIRSIASRIVIFNQGSVLMDGTAQDVLADETVKNVYLGRQGT